MEIKTISVIRGKKLTAESFEMYVSVGDDENKPHISTISEYASIVARQHIESLMFRDEIMDSRKVKFCDRDLYYFVLVSIHNKRILFHFTKQEETDIPLIIIPFLRLF